MSKYILLQPTHRDICKKKFRLEYKRFEIPSSSQIPKKFEIESLVLSDVNCGHGRIETPIAQISLCFNRQQNSMFLSTAVQFNRNGNTGLFPCKSIGEQKIWGITTQEIRKSEGGFQSFFQEQELDPGMVINTLLTEEQQFLNNVNRPRP